MRKIALLAVLAAVSVVVLGAGAVAAEELRIGALVTLSGAGATWGRAMKGAAELAADDVNGRGGLAVGGKKYHVTIVAYDDKYQANEAVTAANRLVFEDKIKFIVGTVGSAPQLAIQPITEKEKAITLTLAFTPAALRGGKQYTFRPVITSEEMSQPQINWVIKRLHVKRVGGLFPNDETGQAIAKANEEAYGKAGATFAAKEFFERAREDFVPLLTRLLAARVDAIELDGNSPTTAGLIVKQARELGFKGAIIRTGGPATEEIVNVAGKQAAEGLYVHSTIDPSVPGVAAYMKRYEERYKEKMNGFSPFFYDGVRMLFAAMQKAGTVDDTDRVRGALEQIGTFDGALGKLRWTGRERYGIDHQIDAPFYIAQVKDGKETIVARCTPKSCE